MAISLEERDRRYSAIREMMKEDELDSLLVAGRDGYMNRGNIRYITNYGVVTGEQYCIFRPEGAPIFITGKGPVMARLKKAEWALDFRVTSDPVAQVVKELSHLAKGNKVGIVGMQDISVPMYLTVQEQFGNRLIDATPIFRRLRLIKSAEEIEKMRTSASIADNVYNLIKDIIRPGLSGYEIYGEMKKTIFEMGCEYSFDLIDAAGSSMNMSFFPTEDRLEANGTLFLEITPAYEGYYAQLPVTLPVGDYSPNVHRMVSAWDKADKAARKALRPGMKVSDLYDILVSTIRENGFISPYRPGHSIGLEVLDFWSITESSSEVLKPGMTLAIHPSVLLEMGGDGCGMGYTYLITDTGAEKLSSIDLAKELIGNGP